MHVDQQYARIARDDLAEGICGDLGAELELDLVDLVAVEAAQVDEPLPKAAAVDDGDALVGLEDAHDGGLHGARPRGCEEHAARGFRRAEQTEHQLLVLEHRLGELRGAEVRGALTADL